MGGTAHRALINRSRELVRQTVQASGKQIPRATTFSTTFSPKYNASLHRLPWASEDACHLSKNTGSSSVAEKPQTGLWWSVITPLSVCQKKTVRSWAQRRFKESFKEALKIRGYDVQGMSISTSREGILRPDLYGSLRIMTLPCIIAAPKALIDAEASRLVESLSVYGSRGVARWPSLSGTGKNKHISKINRGVIFTSRTEGDSRMAATG